MSATTSSVVSPVTSAQPSASQRRWNAVSRDSVFQHAGGRVDSIVTRVGGHRFQRHYRYKVFYLVIPAINMVWANV